MPILTNFVNPSIPVRDQDWEAYVEGREEWLIGRGATREDAITDLLEQIDREVA